jgi:hypothetical protein
MPQVTRQEIFAQAAKKLRQDFAELSVVPHSGLKGGEAEEIIRKFLQGHLPKRFDVGSGIIIDAQDKLSKQIDVIIYDAFNCPVYRASPTAAIIPSDNVAAVIEVKSRLDKERLREAFENASSVKSLVKTLPPDLPILITAQTLCFVFAFETSLTLEKLSEHYCEFAREYNLGRHIDAVMVLDKGVINLAAKPPLQPWGPLMFEGPGGAAGEGAHIGAAIAPAGEDSLDMLLRYILAHLMHFRGLIGHPGFNWMQGGKPMQMQVTYLTSLTNEKDPKLRAEKLRKYAEEVSAEFDIRPPSAEP